VSQINVDNVRSDVSQPLPNWARKSAAWAWPRCRPTRCPPIDLPEGYFEEPGPSHSHSTDGGPRPMKPSTWGRSLSRRTDMGAQHLVKCLCCRSGIQRQRHRDQNRPTAAIRWATGWFIMVGWLPMVPMVFDGIGGTAAALGPASGPLRQLWRTEQILRSGGDRSLAAQMAQASAASVSVPRRATTA
jgi:hypothetical protein